MRIENKIIINRSLSFVFQITNNIAKWPEIFTEYQSTQILEQAENYVKFRLTTVPNGDEKSRSWISERYIDWENKCISAKRLDPIYPFEYMDINWKYEETSEGTCMTWIQEFSMDVKSGYKDDFVALNMNKNTRVQMSAIKNSIESWVEQ